MGHTAVVVQISAMSRKPCACTKTIGGETLPIEGSSVSICNCARSIYLLKRGAAGPSAGEGCLGCFPGLNSTDT